MSYVKIAFKELRPAWFGSCAMGCREPCQVRKEAAISGSSYVPQTSLLQRLRSSLRAIFLDCAKKGKEHMTSVIQTGQNATECCCKKLKFFRILQHTPL